MMTSLRRPAVQLLLVAILGLLAYSNTFQVPFIFDDHTSITENQLIVSLGDYLANGFSHYPRRFIGYLSVAVNYRLGGLDVTGYHLFNLAVHIGCALLVYALARLTLATPFLERVKINEGKEREIVQLVPLLAALFFVLHPVQTQAVTYIIQRLASLATFFYLLTLVLYVRGRLCSAVARRKGALFLAGAIFSALLAMLTKEIAFTLPLVLLLYEFCFLQPSRRKLCLLLLAVLVPLLALPLVIMGPGLLQGDLFTSLAQNSRLETEMPRLDYFFTQLRVIVTYIRLLIFPVGQNLDYDYPIYHSLFQTPVLLSGLLLLALLGTALYLFVRSGAAGGEAKLRLVSFGILWFFVTLSIESSVIPIVDVIYEHRLYLPSVGASLAAATSIAMLLREVRGRGPQAAVAALLLLLACATWQRNWVWQSQYTLWRDAAAKSPGKARPHLNLGSALLRLERTDEAIREFRTAVRLKPDYVEAYSNLGAALTSKGELDQALEQLQIALRLNPDSADALNNVGTCLAAKGMPGDARHFFQAAVNVDPGNPRYRSNLAMASQDAAAVPEAH